MSKQEFNPGDLVTIKKKLLDQLLSVGSSWLSTRKLGEVLIVIKRSSCRNVVIGSLDGIKDHRSFIHIDHLINIKHITSVTEL